MDTAASGFASTFGVAALTFGATGSLAFVPAMASTSALAYLAAASAVGPYFEPSGLMVLKPLMATCPLAVILTCSANAAAPPVSAAAFMAFIALPSLIEFVPVSLGMPTELALAASTLGSSPILCQRPFWKTSVPFAPCFVSPSFGPV